MKRYLLTALCLIFTAGVQANPILPDVEVNVPPEVLSSSGQTQKVQPRNQ